MKYLIIFSIFILTFCSTFNSVSQDKVAVTRDSVLDDNDTIIYNGITIFSKRVDSIFIPNLFSDQKFRDKLTDTIGNSQARAEKIEKYLKTKYSQLFDRTDSVLTLKLEKNKKIQFLKWDEENDEGYSLIGFFPKWNYYLLWVQWGEGNCWMLVNRKNGFKKYIMGEPYFSKSGKK